ncbi:MAG TPA: AzlC family ABC transporter permease [Candidatus Limnocylindria bacterium]|nr:AzlC family ABC transporter permease [Candidatus Limnocylindria bacterium]
MAAEPSVSVARTVAMVAPAAVAIAVFGVLYGAAARPLIGPELTILSSMIVFSGATQFTVIGLLAAGAAAPAVLATAAILNVRHLMMGAVLRSSLGPSRLKRALLAWFLLDESFGFTMLAAERVPQGAERIEVAERTLLVTGLCCYAAWLLGTGLGILGAGLPGLEGVAAAVFPVLFIALAALTARTRSVTVRTVAAAAITAVVCVVLPDWRALAPVVAGLAVALPNDPGPAEAS